LDSTLVQLLRGIWLSFTFNPYESSSSTVNYGKQKLEQDCRA